MGRAIRLLCTIILGLATGGALATAIAIGILGYRGVVVASGSMEPTFQRGDLVFTRPVPIADVKVDDVILFRDGPAAEIDVLHRVVAITNFTVVVDRAPGLVDRLTYPQLLTRGDANADPDDTRVDSSRLRGVAFASLPGIGTLALSTPITGVLFGFAIVTAVTWVALEVLTARRRRARSVSS